MASAVAASVLAELERLCPGGVRPNESLARHVTFRVGGAADVLLVPPSLDHLIASVAWLYREHQPFVVLGRGSNVLVADRGVRGVVIKIGRGQEATHYDSPRVLAQCGVSLPHLARATATRGLAGLEFAAGIPGSIGGGIVMNAGAHGCSLGGVVRQVRVLTPGGERTWSRDEMQFEYRQSRLQREPGVVLDATLELQPADARDCLGRLEAWLRTRSDTQPLGPPSSGCIFRNPEGDHAGRLIDVSGAKGMRVGWAVVSDRHANYILNTGEATASEVLTLIAQARERVRERAGIDLECEIKMIGEFEPPDGGAGGSR